jgi:hypothetical protein
MHRRLYYFSSPSTMPQHWTNSIELSFCRNSRLRCQSHLIWLPNLAAGVVYVYRDNLV